MLFLEIKPHSIAQAHIKFLNLSNPTAASLVTGTVDTSVPGLGGVIYKTGGGLSVNSV